MVLHPSAEPFSDVVATWDVDPYSGGDKLHRKGSARGMTE
jgi:hypothetical protein